VPLMTDEKFLALSRETIEVFDKVNGGVPPGFRPAHAKGILLNGAFTPSAPDGRERQPKDNPSIGVILYRERNRIVEYAHNVSGPVGVAEYRLLIADALPASLADALPTMLGRAGTETVRTRILPLWKLAQHAN
jgi:hypothetical protein